MADLSDVINGLKSIIVATLYPNGTGIPASSVNSAVTIIHGGWPIAKNLDANLSAGTVTVSIFTGTAEKNTSRFLPQWQVMGTVTPGATSVKTVNEVGRSQRDFQISIWANGPALRDVTAGAVDTALRTLKNLPLADGSVAWISYARSAQDDGQQKEGVYVRHLSYSVEYAVFQTVETPLITTVKLNVDGGPDIADVHLNILTLPKAIP